MEKTLSHESIIPLYFQLKEILLETIESGTWLPGDMIPSEIQLQQEYSISRNTVKKALEELVQEGMLNRIQGKGTFVSAPKIEQPLTSFYSFSKIMKSRGLEPKDIIIGLKKNEARMGVSKKLQLTDNKQVYELQRLRCSGDEPIILETSYIPSHIFPNLSETMIEKNSLYDVMQIEYGIYVTKAKEVFEPVLIRSHESMLLQVREGNPALLLERIAYDNHGLPVEFCRSLIRGDRCRFYTELL
ncbi:GntR family transcriptional regulator [Peribacillus muralis]|uniref:GntR family transcriptional regulator n=1 Tax=Peribacillus muralis TaxID=264697 RepID=UPI001F4E44C8|nr:GntR family transcriptional regulator [Peribacillus muralis]MCK1992943.1 GntR family transcriptional regulator [Peribacillus muralis]MCK2013498.1 GntR family transcriptional regulator [Peribacillus muralis]